MKGRDEEFTGDINDNIFTWSCRNNDPEEKDEFTGGELPEEDDEENNP